MATALVPSSGAAAAALARPKSGMARRGRRIRAPRLSMSLYGGEHQQNFAFSAQDMMVLRTRIEQQHQLERRAALDKIERDCWMTWEAQCHPALQWELSRQMARVHDALLGMRPSTVLALLSVLFTCSTAASLVGITMLANLTSQMYCSLG